MVCFQLISQNFIKHKVALFTHSTEKKGIQKKYWLLRGLYRKKKRKKKEMHRKNWQVILWLIFFFVFYVNFFTVFLQWYYFIKKKKNLVKLIQAGLASALYVFIRFREWCKESSKRSRSHTGHWQECLCGCSIVASLLKSICKISNWFRWAANITGEISLKEKKSNL